MTTVSPVHQLVTHLMNSSRAKRSSTIVPRSSVTRALLQVLKGQGLIRSFEPESLESRPVFRVALQEARLELRAISRPGLRVYRSFRELKEIREREKLIVSTSQGLMTADESVRRHLGGELMARIEE